MISLSALHERLSKLLSCLFTTAKLANIFIIKTASVVQWSEFLATNPQVPASIPELYKKVVGLERSPPSLVSTTEELLGRNNSCSGLESQNTAVGIRHADHVAPSIHTKKLALTSLTSGGHSVGIFHLWNQATEFFFRLHFVIFQKMAFYKQVVRTSSHPRRVISS
jgi:hypothetical protein